MPTLTVRINRECHEKIRQIAEETEQAMVSVIENAVEEYRRKRFLERVNADFAQLKKNRRAWKEELRERRLWETTLSDGLEKE